MQADRWRGAERVYAWSFFSQGSGDGREASEDLFLARAIAWFGVDLGPAAHPADKGRALADRLQTSRTLLILDGLEPLQHPPGPLAGELRAPGLKALLGQLAAAGHPGLCLVTSREWLQDLSFRVRTDTNPQGPVLRLDLQALSDTDGARLLHARGATRAGAAEITPDDPELLAASREVRGHALTLSLLGGYLGLAQEGDIRRRDQVDLHQADAETAAGRVFRVMAAYERWLTPPDAAAGATPSRELAALRLFGFVDRPARPELLEALREAPHIPGLTEALFAPGTAPGNAGVSPAPARRAVSILALARNAWQSLTRRKAPIGGVPAGGRRSQVSPTQWRTALARLEQIGLLYPPTPAGPGTPTHWCGSTWPMPSGPAARTPGGRATGGSTSGSRHRSPTAPRAWTGSSPSTRPWPTAARRGCGRRSASRSIATASRAGPGPAASTAPASSGPSVRTSGPSPASSPSPGSPQGGPGAHAGRG